MNDQSGSGGWAAGILLLLFGLWVLLRTVNKGTNGANLADYLLGGPGSGSKSDPWSTLGLNLGQFPVTNNLFNSKSGAPYLPEELQWFENAANNINNTFDNPPTPTRPFRRGPTAPNPFPTPIHK